MARRGLVALAWALLLVACGDDGGAPPAADADVDGGAGPCGELPADLDVSRDPACPDGANWVAAIESGVEDLAGDPLPGAFFQTCIRLAPSGNLVCLRPSQACDDGRVALVVPEANRCMASAKVRALRIGAAAADGRTFATSYCPLDGAADEGRLTAAPVTLYPTRASTQDEPAGPDAPRTVRYDLGLEVVVDPTRVGLRSDEIAELRAVGLEPDRRPCFLPDAFEPLGLWGFSPEPTRSPDVQGAPLEMRVPNTTGLPAGTEVDLYVLGSLTCTVDGEVLEEGDWHRYGTARVDDEGAAIDATLPCLSWFGYALHQGDR